jgi:phage FluMu protein Com
MSKTIRCFACEKINPIKQDDTKCPSCGSSNIEEWSEERYKESFKAGALYSIDSKGKRFTPKK